MPGGGRECVSKKETCELRCGCQIRTGQEKSMAAGGRSWAQGNWSGEQTEQRSQEKELTGRHAKYNI